MDLSKFEVLVYLIQITELRGDFLPKSIILSTDIGCTCVNGHNENPTEECAVADKE